MSPLLAIEEDITSIKAAVRLLGHLSSSTDMDIRPGDLEAIRGMVENYIDDIECRWKEALELEQAAKAAHEEALAAAKAEKAAPGSPAELRHATWLWGILRRAASISLEECERVEAASPEGALS
jgi:hypothetical protein